MSSILNILICLYVLYVYVSIYIDHRLFLNRDWYVDGYFAHIGQGYHVA